MTDKQKEQMLDDALFEQSRGEFEGKYCMKQSTQYRRYDDVFLSDE